MAKVNAKRSALELGKTAAFLGVLPLLVYLCTQREPAESVPRIDQELMEAFALAEIKSYPDVRDAAVSQDGDRLSLVIVGQYSMGASRARELGEKFVRLVKSVAKDGPLGKEIGRGRYNYLVGVFKPDETQIAMGAKDRTARAITW